LASTKNYAVVRTLAGIAQDLYYIEAKPSGIPSRASAAVHPFYVRDNVNVYVTPVVFSDDNGHNAAVTNAQVAADLAFAASEWQQACLDIVSTHPNNGAPISSDEAQYVQEVQSLFTF
jgi:hypothetical protein